MYMSLLHSIMVISKSEISCVPLHDNVENADVE